MINDKIAKIPTNIKIAPKKLSTITIISLF